jgi:hypothetical protein
MSRPKRAVLVIHEAAGKRIRRLSLAEPYVHSRNIYISIEFDDETEILIEVESRPYFSIMHLLRNSHGDLEPEKELLRGTLRSLVKTNR